MSEALDIFIDHLVTNGLEYFRSFYGSYRAIVVRNDDPENRGRIQVTAPPFGSGETLDLWIDPTFHGAGPNRGMFWPPEVGDVVWVKFDRGRHDFPLVYEGGWHGTANVPKEFTTSTSSQAKNKVPERRGFVTRIGHMLIFCDEQGKESIRIVRHIPDAGDAAMSDRSKSANRAKGTWSTILMEPNGDVRISNDNGSFLHLDAEHKEAKLVDEHGNSLTMADAGIKLIDSKANMITIDNGKVNIISSGDVTVNAPTFTAFTGGTNLSQGASQPVILGLIYTAARAIMNGLNAVAWQTLGAHLSGEGALAQTVAAALIGPPPPAAAPALVGILLPFFQGISPTALAAGPMAIAAGAGVTAFEAAAPSYLSLVTKTA